MAAASPRTARAPFAERVDSRSLRQGGRLAILTNPHAPTVTIVGMLQAGPAMATDGRFSVPSVTASMLKRGAAGMDRMHIARELEDHGLQLDLGASAAAPASVSFSLQGLAEELPRLVRLLAEVLLRPTFPADELEKVRAQILGVLRHEKDDTSTTAFAALSRRLHPVGHPHRRRTVAEREEEVRGISREDLESFHRSVYGEATLACAVVGDVAPDEVHALFGEAFAEWGPGRTGLPQWPRAPESQGGGERIFIADRPNLDVFLGHAGTLLLGDPEYPAAVLANSCLGQSTLTSRLGVAVRDKAGLTYGVNSGFTGKLQAPGPWIINLSVSAGDLDRAVSLCRSVVEDYVEEGPTEAEIEDERRAWAGAYTVGLATNVGVARELVRVMVAGRPISRLDDFAPSLLRQTREEVLAAVRKYMHPERLVMVAAGTLPAATPSR